MKLLICLSSVFAVVSAGGYFYAQPEIRAPIVLSSFGSSQASATQQQYYNQDAYGQYSYGYSEPLSSKQEVRTLDGLTRGSYSYIDADGKLQTVDYTADAEGFRVSATNLPRPLRTDSPQIPQPVMDTAEVMAARAQHLAAYKEAVLRASMSPVSVPTSPPSKSVPVVAVPNPKPYTMDTSIQNSVGYEVPRPVEDTDEVAAAKVQFFKLYKQEQKRNEILKDQKIPSYGPLVNVKSLVLNPVPVAATFLPAPIIGGNFPYTYKYALPAVKRTYLPVA